MTYIEQWHIRFKLKKIKAHQKNMSAQFIWPSNQLLWQSNEYIKKKSVSKNNKPNKCNQAK